MPRNAEKEKMVKTSIILPYSLWRDVKVFAAKNGLKLSRVVEEALKEYLRERSSEEK
ncbi:MAG TPA: hypothetical protein VNL13_02875 [Sulfolobales archaeon]|nr:hypothetical protein [Sulfolobales archaeon]